MKVATAEPSDGVVNLNPVPLTGVTQPVKDGTSNLKYEPLGADEIRLVNLHPGSWDDPITCQLETHRLEDCPKYLALSYVWGGMDDSIPVTVNGQRHRVGMSLFTALRRLRERIFGSGSVPGPKEFASELWSGVATLYIWADWLCLNQEDGGEKQTQIPRMGAIFGKAARVVAWLGENKDADEEERVKLLVGLCRIRPPPDVLYPWWAESYQEQLYSVMGERTTDLTAIFYTLFLRPFFMRLWIIQEMSLADLPPLMLAGGHWCDLLSLERVWRFVRAAGLLAQYQYPFYTIHFHVEVFVRLRKLHRSSQPTVDGPASAVDTLNRYFRAVQGVFAAARPHDQLYGLLGVVGGGGDAPPLPRALRPNYAAPFAEVYKEYAMALLRDCGDLSIINRNQGDLEGVPSWVPDFRAQPWSLEHEALPGTEFQGDKMVVRGVVLERCTAAWYPHTVVRNCCFLSEAYDLPSKVSRMREFFLLASEGGGVSMGAMVDDLMRMCLSVTGVHDTRDAPLLRDLVSRSVELGRPVESERWRTAAGELGFAFDAPLVATGRGAVDKLVRCDLEPTAGDVVCAIEGSSMAVLLKPRPEEGEYEFEGMCHRWEDGASVNYDRAWFDGKELQSFVLV
ncbi:heterokaryon incompatibility [Colletotrichum sojae]|uniref:Heterokaryon incompatibility n=1 Tax=Colletotrichum sojae TaxID=2175907 RepID=A0A8H6MT93_9PEZI|nr:heterokaryon incompatibility [Colletotrichum sojae]